MGSQALERIRQRAASGKQPQTPESDWGWARRLTLAAGLLSLAGTLVGFGTARAYDAMFGLSYGLWFDSPLDLLILASDAVIGLVHAIWSGFSGPQLWVQSGMFSLTVTGLAAVPVAGKWAASMGATKHWRVRFARKLMDLADWMGTPQLRLAQNLSRAAVAATLSFGAVWCSVLGLVGLLALALCAVSFVPLLGTWGATAYARAAIVEPASCISPLPARLEAKSTKVGAPCVEVRDPATGTVVTGRLVFARGSKVFLYLKEEGRGRLLNAKDADITSRSLETPRPARADFNQP
jgi:hypothetical protein